MACHGSMKTNEDRKNRDTRVGRKGRRLTRYRVSVRGAVPADLGERVNQAWASLLAAGMDDSNAGAEDRSEPSTDSRKE